MSLTEAVELLEHLVACVPSLDLRLLHSHWLHKCGFVCVCVCAVADLEI